MYDVSRQERRHRYPSQKVDLISDPIYSIEASRRRYAEEWRAKGVEINRFLGRARLPGGTFFSGMKERVAANRRNGDGAIIRGRIEYRGVSKAYACREGIFYRIEDFRREYGLWFWCGCSERIRRGCGRNSSALVSLALALGWGC